MIRGPYNSPDRNNNLLRSSIDSTAHYAEKISLSEVAPFLSRFTHLRALGLIDIALDEGDALRHWPRPIFELESLELYFECSSGASLGLDEYDWFTHSSRDSLRHLAMNVVSPEMMSNPARWGPNLRSLEVRQYHGSVEVDSRDKRFSQAVDVIRLGRREGLDKLKLFIMVWDESDSKDACATFEDDVQAVAQEVNNDRGREVVDVTVDWQKLFPNLQSDGLVDFRYQGREWRMYAV